MKNIRIPLEILKNIGAGIPFLRHAKEKHSQTRTNLLNSWERPFAVLAQMRAKAGDELEFTDKIILEVGPGNSLAMGLLFLALGAKKVFLIDRFKHLFWDEQDIAFHREILQQIEARQFPHAARALSAITFTKNGTALELDQNKIEYRLGDGVRLPLPDAAIDLVFSNAVFEHVHDVAGSLQELSRITRKGGLGIHEVDLRDHFFQTEPLRLLQYPTWLWNAMSWNRPGYTNRLRYSDFECLFKRAGFQTRKNVILREYTEELTKLRLAQNFRSYSETEIKILVFWLFVQKEN